MLAVDVQGVDKLRLQAKQDPDKALKEVAQQFEVLFMNMMLKSMRDATPKDGLFDSEQTKFYTSMLDMQYAQSLSAKGIGLADVMIKQLTRSTVTPEELENMPNGISLTPDTSPATPSGTSTPLPASQTKDFVSTLWPYAQAASQATGIPAHFMMAQAALESGWGKNEIRRADGSPSFNVFGIKAGRNWSGPVAETVTTEYVNGVAQKSTEKFRAYSSYAEGFRDYANLLLNNPRYAAVLEQQDAAGFARGLQQAGYATDPMYADKLMRILNGSTLRNSLVG
jgi:flagellar protein FlgJ